MLSTPIAEEEMGMHQLYWVYRCTFATTMRHTQRYQATSFEVPTNQPVDRMQTTFLTYTVVLSAMQFLPRIPLLHARRRRAGTNLIQNGNGCDARLITQHTNLMAQEDVATRYGLNKPRWHALEGDTVRKSC